MHVSAFYIGGTAMELYCDLANADVMEIGSYNVNGTLRDHVREGTRYIGVDVEAGPGVDMVVAPGESLPFEDEAFDLVLASSVFEHDPCFWDTFVNMVRKTRIGGYVYLNVPSNGTIHRYPNDCWRFYPDAGVALVEWARRQGLEVNLVESFMAERQGDVWNDFVAIFRRGPLDATLPTGFVHERFACVNVRNWKAAGLVRPREETEDMLLLMAIQNPVVEQKDPKTRLLEDITGQGREIEVLRKALATANQEASRLRDAITSASELNEGVLAALDPVQRTRMNIQTDFAFDVRIAVEEAQRLAEKGVGIKIKSLKYGDVSADGAAIVGGDGFLFIDGGSNAWSLQIRGEASIDEATLARCEVDIDAFERQCTQRGIASCIVIVPEKDIVYPELSPNCAGIELGPRSVHRLQDRRPGVCYPLDQLVAAKADALIYHRRDSHFNAFGGLIVTNNALTTMGFAPIEYSDVPFAHREFQDDLAVKWEAFPTMRRIVPFDYVEEVLQEGNPLTGLHIRLRSTAVQNSQTVMIFGDSYSWNPDAGLSRFMTRRFETVHFIWGRDVNWDLVDAVAPSAVVLQAAERFLIQGLVYRKTNDPARSQEGSNSLTR